MIAAADRMYQVMVLPHCANLCDNVNKLTANQLAFHCQNSCMSDGELGPLVGFCILGICSHRVGKLRISDAPIQATINIFGTQASYGLSWRMQNPVSHHPP